jgi:hypothetical protein
VTNTISLRSGMMRKYHVPFWRAAALARESLTLIVNAAKNILNLAKAREGHSQSNASGVGINTLLGVSLVGQILTRNEESPYL